VKCLVFEKNDGYYIYNHPPTKKTQNCALIKILNQIYRLFDAEVTEIASFEKQNQTLASCHQGYDLKLNSSVLHPDGG